MSETWTNKSSNIDLKGYSKPVHSYRRYQHKRAKRSSGGLIIYIRDTFRKGIKVIKNKYDWLVWLKLDKHHFRMTSDVYLAVTYVAPENSPMHKIHDEDPFRVIETDIGIYKELGKVFITGDMNARTGKKLDFITNNSIFENIVNRQNGALLRATQDHKSNRYGDLLIDLCKSSDVCIVNGRLYDDAAKGKYTCTMYNGSSVVDYLLTNERDMNQLVYFNVEQFNTFSFKILHEKTATNISKINYCRWNPEKKTSFIEDLNSEIHILEEKLKSEIAKESNTDTIVDVFTSYLNEKGNKYFYKNVKHSTCEFTSPDKFKQKWYNDECKLKYKAFKEAVNNFNCTQNDDNRRILYEKKKDYKYCCRKIRNTFRHSQCKQLNEVRRKRPQEFWSIFRKRTKTSTGDIISNEEFFKYFKNLANPKDENFDNGSKQYVYNFENTDQENEPTFEELDQTISLEEIKKASRQLGNNKTCSVDNILYEYFKENIDSLCYPLKLLFNYILDSKSFPRCWSTGSIKPLYKKGDSTDTNNYRGITITSCFAKFFTVILNERLKNWALNNDILTDAQFGFKPNHCTVDAIYCLNALIERQFQAKGKLYCCFIDFKKAYDFIDRYSLWFKLLQLGVDGKLFSVIRSMYDEVKLCVSHLNSYSDYFSSEIGLFQGEITSPMMFSLFLNDIENAFHHSNTIAVTIDQLSIYLLLFADDAVMFAESKEALQENLNCLKSYCDKWSLTVNVEKTKVMIFRKKGVLKEDYTWTYQGENIEMVESFSYLGLVFSCRGSFVQATYELKGKALRSMNALFNVTNQLDVPINIMLDLFDSHVQSVLNYSCEVWGHLSAENLELVHKKFCKWILNVKTSTSTLAIYAELGRYPLQISRYIRIVKYWLKLYQEKSHNCILRTLTLDQRSRAERDVNIVNWSSKVRDILQNAGFREIWLYPESVNANVFVPLLRQRLRDMYICTWQESIKYYSSLSLFRQFKIIFERSSYLDILTFPKYRNIISKLRLTSHKLRIETGRHENIERNQRICTLCNLNDLEDEFHFVLVCPFYETLRKQLIPRYYAQRPSMYKFIELLNTERKKYLCNLASFCLKAFEMRKLSI